MGFRVCFFFSFFGRIVSVLGFIRTVEGSTLPEAPRSPTPTPRATCGTELTVSVSTIIFRTEPSPGFPRALFKDV